MFRRTYSDSATTYEIEGAVVPYCNPCIAQHEHEVRALSWPQRVAVSLTTGLTISALGSGFMALLFLPDAVRSLTRSGFPWPLVVVMFFALIAYSSLSGAWKQNAHRRVPPQTGITRAFDFSESHAEMFDAPRSTYSIRNSAFAEAFVALNRARIWNPQTPAAKRSAHSRKLLYAVTIGALVAWALWDLATDLFGR